MTSPLPGSAEDNDLVTLPEAASQLHVSPSTISSWVRRGAILKHPNGRGYRIRLPELRAWREQQEQLAAAWQALAGECGPVPRSELLLVREAAVELQVSYAIIQAACRNGSLLSQRRGSQHWIRRKHLEAWQQRRRQEPRDASLP